MQSLKKKLGRLPSGGDPRTLRLADYFLASLPTPPAACDWGKDVAAWPVMENDVLGDCTVAAAGHMIQEWTADESGLAVVIPDISIVAAYAAVSGYDPASGAGDDGAAILDVLKYWQKTGIGGHRIYAYASVPPLNRLHCRQGIFLFGALDLGINMPLAWRQAAAWDIGKGRDFRPGSWGGHSVPAVAYDAAGVTVVSWGGLYKLTWAAVDRYVEEAWAVLSPDWTSGGNAKSGFNMSALRADLKAIAQK